MRILVRQTGCVPQNVALERISGFRARRIAACDRLLSGGDAAFRGNISPAAVDRVWVRRRRRPPFVGGGRRGSNGVFGNVACQHAPYHFDTMSHGGEYSPRRRGCTYFGREHSASEVGQSVIRKDFRPGIDAVRCADAEARIKSRDVGLNQSQRVLRALLAWTLSSSDVFKSRQQCDVSVHQRTPQPHFEKGPKRPAVFRKRMTNAAGGGEFQRFLNLPDILKRRFPASNTGAICVRGRRALTPARRVSRSWASLRWCPTSSAGRALRKRRFCLHPCSAGEAIALPCAVRQVVVVPRGRRSGVSLRGQMRIFPR